VPTYLLLQTTRSSGARTVRALPCDLTPCVPSAATTQVYYNPSSHYPTGARVATTANVVANTTANMGALPCTFFFFWLGSELSSECRAVLKSTAPSCAEVNSAKLCCVVLLGSWVQST
jgi:hypothetical protein